ncbi:hypothetical protein ACLKA6_008689 [Drosophila palustris]
MTEHFDICLIWVPGHQDIPGNIPADELYRRGTTEILLSHKVHVRLTLSQSFKEDDGTWKGNDDGKVVNNQPQRVMDERNGMMAQSGYIGRITNDAREDEMEDNMGQVNTMVGNLRNMALDMGSELENQNRQVDRINRKGESNESRIAVANQRAHQLLK